MKLTYREEVIRAMQMLASQPNTLFLGQSVAYKGNVIYQSLANIPAEQKLELPVFEETQLGISIGLAMAGMLPVSVFPRFNFLLLAMNQLVNHLDKIPVISKGGFNPKVIIKTMVGSKQPLHPGIQHCGDFTEALKLMLDTVVVEKLVDTKDVYPAYERALLRKQSTVLVEVGDSYTER